MKVLGFIEIMILSADGFLKHKSISRLQYTDNYFYDILRTHGFGIQYFHIHKKLLM